MIRLFRVVVPTSLLALMVVEAALAFGCYLIGFTLTRDEDWVIYYQYEGGTGQTLAAVGCLVLGIYLNDLYSQVRVYSRLRLVQQFCLVFGIAFLTQGMISYVVPQFALSRSQMIAGSVLGLIVLPAWRMLFDLLVLRVLHRQKILFLGHNRLVQVVARTVAERPHFAMEPVGYLSPGPMAEASEWLGCWLGPLSAVVAAYTEHKPDRIVVGLDDRREKLPVEDLLALRMKGVPVEDVSNLYEHVMWRVPLEALLPSQLVFGKGIGPDPRKLAFQRTYSFVIALTGAVLTLPLMALIWLMVRLTSRGPAIYRQRRVGRNGRVFEVLKFRSMYQDAEARTGAVWASQNDPRVTPLGRWLRLLRLDELPQFFNVLQGEMCIVGPRPERPEFVEVLSKKIPYYSLRHAIPPGITGWAQINHRYGDSVEDVATKLEYDLYYLKNQSFSLDLYILFHTAKVMLFQRGAQ